MSWIQRDRPSPKGMRLLALALALAALAATAISQLALATHPRPRGATPIRASLVPAFKQCTAPNRTHGAPLAFPSCSPPIQESNSLTVGTPDVNGAGANSIGSAVLKVPPNTTTEELVISGSISDVRCLPGTSPAVCSGVNAADGPDYSGELLLDATIRISDHNNGSDRDEAATVVDIPMPVHLKCVNTPDTSIGGLCNVPPPSCLGCFPGPAGHRSVIGFTQLRVSDGGPDGQVATADNTLFMKQGIFIP